MERRKGNGNSHQPHNHLPSPPSPIRIRPFQSYLRQRYTNGGIRARERMIRAQRLRQCQFPLSRAVHAQSAIVGAADGHGEGLGLFRDDVGGRENFVGGSCPGRAGCLVGGLPGL